MKNRIENLALEYQAFIRDDILVPAVMCLVLLAITISKTLI